MCKIPFLIHCDQTASPRLTAALFLVFSSALYLPVATSADVLGALTGLRDARALPLGVGSYEVAAIATYVDGEEIEFFHSEQDRLSAPQLYAAYGIGPRAYVEAAWDYRSIDDEEVGSQNGAGDLRLATHIELSPRSWQHTALALRVAVKLPNADDEERLGTDETDFGAQLLISRDLTTHWRGYLHAGLDILGDPRERSVQDDGMSLGVGIGKEGEGWRSRLGVEGRELTPNDNDTLRLVAAGAYDIRPGLSWLIGAQMGLDGLAGDWGLQTGIALTGDR